MTKSICVWYWFIGTGRYIVDFVNKTSHDKGGAERTRMKSGNGAIG